MLSQANFSDIKYSRWDTCINPLVTLCECVPFVLAGAFKHIQSELIFHFTIRYEAEMLMNDAEVGET